MGKYVDDVDARRALDVAAQYADMARGPLPFVWTGAEWTTPGGERRDLPLIRRGMGEWLADVVAGLRWRHAPALEAAAEREYRLRRARALERDAVTAEAGAQAVLLRKAQGLRREADAMPSLPASVTLDDVEALKSVSDEMLSASNGRATQLLSLASQFDHFRAPMRDPAEWVRLLGAAPRSVHVRTSVVWDAFCVAEPVLSRSLGTVMGKRALFAAMDRRFGARRKLSGYEGWRGVALSE
ncbi:hypothetical protein [Streptomyces noursei]|uniref:hypothetical protein n=1 Tax=Streptomyces noursei TaxID=1971 RepID=UPI00382764B9